MITIKGITYPSDFEAKKKIIEISKRMEEKGYAIGGDGSISTRVGPNAIWITLLGADKGALTQDMLIRIGIEDGKPLYTVSSKQLPEDWEWHVKIYKENPNLRSIIHGYPPKVNAWGIKGLSIKEAIFSPAIKKLGAMKLLQGNYSAEDISTQSKYQKGVILQNDGCMVWGEDIIEAYQFLQTAEYYVTVMDATNKYLEVTMQNEKEQSTLMDYKKLKGVTPIISPKNEIKVESSDKAPVSQVLKASESEKKVPQPEGQRQVNINDKTKTVVMEEVVCRMIAQFNNL